MTEVLKPLYTTFSSVKIRLTNKVQFQSQNPPLDGEVPDVLLAQLISDAETTVEQDLRSRYAVPFQSKSKGNFHLLPDHSQRALRTVIDYKAAILILSFDFGRGTHVSAEPYIQSLEKLYDDYIEKLLGHDNIGKNGKIDRYKYSPPLDDLLLAASNRAADDGYRGMIINSDASRHDAEAYAADNINNPSEAWNLNSALGGNGR